MERKEAIEVIKKNYPHVNVSGSQFETALRILIPELIETEDERIINNIKKVIVWYRGMFTEKSLMPEEYQEINAWLEKQGEKVEPIEGFNSEFERQISQLIASIINKEHEYTEAFVKWTSDALLNYAKHEINKQGEQKPILNFNANDWYVSKTDNKIHNMYHSVDKVEPKFKIGDYVKNVNDKREPIYEIVYMDKECYICEYRGKERMGDKAVMHFVFDNPYLRLVEPKFKVKYAGSEYNVLEVKDIAGVTFYGIEDEPNHIDYVKAKNCEIISGYGIKENGSSYPTKPAVFSEQSPSWSEEDEKTYVSILNDLRQNVIPDEEDIDWLKSLKERVQPQSQWKPSDEQIEAVRLAAEIGTANSSWAMGILKSMYQDLKKLKE